MRGSARRLTLALAVASLAFACAPPLAYATTRSSTTMTAPTATKETYEKADLSGKKTYAAVNLHNLNVIDLRSITTKLDADSGVTDANYGAQLTVKEIGYEGYTAIGSVTARTYSHPAQQVDEEIFLEMVTQLRALVSNITTIKTKLNADGGVTDSNYANASTYLTALGVTGGSNKALLPAAGDGPNSKLLQELADRQADVATALHVLAAKLELDATVNTATYQAGLTAKILTQLDH